MSKEEAVQRIREIASKNKSLIGMELEICFIDKRTGRQTKEKIKIEE